MGQMIIVVSADRIELLSELSREFDSDSVWVLIDRRHYERRQRPGEQRPGSHERRRRDRRLHDLTPQLEEFGFAVIAVP